jgi:hypothetical protein
MFNKSIPKLLVRRGLRAMREGQMNPQLVLKQSAVLLNQPHQDVIRGIVNAAVPRDEDFMMFEKVVEMFELTVPIVDGDVLTFRFELLSSDTTEGQQFRCRLYRLENIRVRVRAAENTRGKKWEDADYRCWVVDDNLGIEGQFYHSLDMARNGAITTLKAQLGGS